MLEAEVRRWWEDRPAEQRKVLIEAARDFRMDADVRDLLSDTGCPLGSPEENMKHGRRFLWPDLLRRVVLEDAG